MVIYKESICIRSCFSRTQGCLARCLYPECGCGWSRAGQRSEEAACGGTRLCVLIISGKRGYNHRTPLQDKLQLTDKVSLVKCFKKLISGPWHLVTGSPPAI